MKIITTEDGSDTLFSDEFNETYHSGYGALAESRHVFIKNGLDYALDNHKPVEEIRIFEVGFGTGLNALLTMLEGEKRNFKIYYETIELFPVPIETIKALNYTNLLGYEHCYGPYHTMHLCTWNIAHPITKDFTFKKVNASLLDYASTAGNFHVIYFDAFAPDAQPELWTTEVMRKMYDALLPGGMLVSYCSKVSFQKALKEAGFLVEKLPGPPHKREMVRAVKK